MSDPAAKDFAARLRRACDTHDRVELREYGRQAAIARAMAVSEETVRKWFGGMMAPRPEKQKALAEFLGVDRAWLMFGKENTDSKSEKKMFPQKSSGAALFVRGFLQVCGIVTLDSSTDTRNYIDFFAGIEGQLTCIKAPFVQLQGKEFFVAIPFEYKELRILAVVLENDGVSILDMSNALIDRHAFRKDGDLSVRMEKISRGIFATDGDTWHKLLPSDLRP